jgi:hypothetical protein
MEPNGSRRRYSRLVLASAWTSTRALLADLRVELLLLAVSALLVIALWLGDGSVDQPLWSILWGVVALVVLALLTFVFNLVRAPARLHAAQEADLARLRAERADSEARVRSAARQLGTELREIRHAIERVRAWKPHPIYPDGFAFPAYRWDEFDELLAAEAPDLYETVERAYVAAHSTNEVLRIRRQGARGRTLGETPDDRLDKVYELAAEALDALGEERGPVWETPAQEAVRLVTEDILREAGEQPKP